MANRAQAIETAKLVMARPFSHSEYIIELAEVAIEMAKDLEAYRIIDEVLEVANRCESCGGQPAECDC